MDAEDLRFSPEHLAKIIELTEAGTINNSVAKEVFEKVFDEDIDPERYVEEHGLKSDNDEDALRATIEQIVKDNPAVGGGLPQRKRESNRIFGRTDDESNPRQGKSGNRK